MHENQATAVSLLTQTLKLDMKVSFSHHDYTHERGKNHKEFTLLFAVKRTHSSVAQHAFFYISISPEPSASAAQLLYCVSLFLH